MKGKEEIVKKVNKLLSDERMQKPPQDIFSNAPLALIQVEIANKIHALNWVLGDDAVDLSSVRYFERSH